MNYIKDLFTQGRYHIFIGIAILIETQRNYLIPYSNLYKNIRKNVIQQSKLTNPDLDFDKIELEMLTQNDKNMLKAVTKFKVQEIQNLCKDKHSTVFVTASILGLGAVNFFLNPMCTAIFVPSYLVLLSIDFIKSISVIKFGKNPLWTWKMKDIGYLTLYTFCALTAMAATKAGISKLKQKATQASKSMILKNQSQNQIKKE